MKKILINGSFFCRNLTGIERFAYEITLRLDLLAQKGELSVLIPSNADDSKIPSYKNIQIIKSSKSCRIFPVWEHIHFSAVAKKMILQMQLLYSIQVQYLFTIYMQNCTNRILSPEKIKSSGYTTALCIGMPQKEQSN